MGRPFEKPGEGNHEAPEHPLPGVERHFRIAAEPVFGIGRGALAYPDFAHDVLEKDELNKQRICKMLTYCTYLMRRKDNPLGQWLGPSQRWLSAGSESLPDLAARN